MRRKFLKTAAAAALAALGATGAVVAQEDAASFYDGNVIKFIVPYDPGGGYDEYARMIAPYLEKYTGSRVDIENMPGSGGMKGAVEIFNSPADGTYIGIINGSAMVTNQLAEIEGADYKVGDYNFLGRMVADPRVLVVGANSGIDSFETMQSDGKPVIVGATGLGGSTYVDAVIIGDAFGIDQRVVHGFDRSGDIRTAMLRGDVNAMWGSLGSALEGLAAGDHKVILHAEKEARPEFEGAPSIYEIAETVEDPERAKTILRSWEALNDVGRPVAAPPGVPEDRLAFLRDAFEQAMNDEEFLAEATESKRDLLFASGEEMSQIAKDATDLDPEIHDLFVRAIRGEI